MSTSKTNPTAPAAVESFGWEVIPEPPKSIGGAMPPAEADALMTALRTGWVKAPETFKTEKEAADASWKLRVKLVRAGRITKVGDLERRIVQDGDVFRFALGKKAKR